MSDLREPATPRRCLTRRQLLVTTSAMFLAACSPAAPTAAPKASESKPADAKPTAAAAPAKPAESKPAEAAKPAATAPAAPPKAEAKAPGQPQRGGTIRLPIFTEPLPLNAVIATELSSLLIRRVLYSYLTRIDPQTKQPVPDLATKWDVSSDGLTWTFQLRDDVKWHDGAPFSAEDVKFTFDAIADPKNSSVERTNYTDVASVEAVDRTTVRFKLSNPLMSLPVITGATVGILPKHLLDGKDMRSATEFNNQRPIGTGPYKIKAIVPGSHVELVAHEEFYHGRPNADTVIFKLIPDANVRLAQLKSGELDFATIEPDNLQAVQGDRSLVLEELPAPEWHYYVPNHENALLADRRIRLALTHGLDRQAILNQAALGKGVLQTATIPIALKDWYNDELKPYPYDEARAKSLLAEAGWQPGGDGILAKDGQRLAFEIQVDNISEVRKQMAVVAQQFWKRLGMDVSIQVLERGVWADNLRNHKFAVSISNTPSSWDPDTQRRFYPCKAGSNFGLYCNPKVDELLSAGVREVDVAKRKAIYKEYQQVVYDDVHVIPGYYINELRVTSAKLKGLPPLPIRDVMTYIDSWYLDR